MTYTPSTARIRRSHEDQGVSTHDSEQYGEEFDRWLAAHDAEVRADERARIVAAIDTALQNAEDNDY